MTIYILPRSIPFFQFSAAYFFVPGVLMESNAMVFVLIWIVVLDNADVTLYSKVCANMYNSLCR
ncbi:MAG: hypothetical protein H8E41_12100 [Desulfobulbaceae bacterium]|uniref:Uncharacterized protein n=1 Tax=Candidatus Desulfobia pelagia TaxID=2841692 RepID=A0A8J6TGB4_9BACT|nr:hypothetical protein [Candidatus Desulfobia pelagia]